jgi:sulfur carrier protein ThiS
MPDIRLRLFGFGSKASGWEIDTRSVPQGTTASGVWKSLRSSAEEGALLARIDERNVFYLVNGKLIPRTRLEETVLEDGDTVTFMVMAIGGQSERVVGVRRPRSAGYFERGGDQ